VGITGYDWGSKPAEITDGMSNTIYMIQVPPGHNRPWIAGGGATVMGVDETNPMADFVHAEPTGKRGTYALMADGSVRHIPDNIDPAVFKALVTRAGGESIDELDKKTAKLPVPKGMEAELTGAIAAKKAADRAKVDPAELQKIQGAWKVAYMYKGGKAMTAAELDSLEMSVEINDVNLTVTAAGNAQVLVIRQLDPKTNPRQITFQNDDEANTGTASVGIYVIEDKKLRMRYIKNATPDKRPKEVKIPDEGGPENEYYVELIREAKQP
jgi:uncharacterized protein (TIGR03067 family)